MSPEDAWVQFERRRADVAEIGEDLERIRAAVDIAQAAQDHDAVIALAALAAERAASVELGLAAGMFSSDLGTALLQRKSPDRALDLERAIGAFEAALDCFPPGELAASLMGDLALVYAERVRCDRAENLRLSAATLREAIARVPAGGDPELRARLGTNLSMVLLRGEQGDRRAGMLDRAG